MNPMHALYRFVGLMLLMVALSFAWTQVRAADEHAHDAAGGTLTLDNGRKWPTDAPLRQAMSRIGEALSAHLPAIHDDTLEAAQYAALGRAIDAQVAYMVENCKLAPDADAMLHLLLAELLHGSEAMQGKAAYAKPRSGAIAVAGALRDYGQYFDHPGWQAPAR